MMHTRFSAFAVLVVACLAGTFAQAQDQKNEVRCTGGGTTCKASFLPKFASNGGSATVSDSIVSQSGTTIKVAGSEVVSGGLAAGGTVSAGAFSGNGASVTNVNAATLNGLSSGAFAQLGADNTFTGSQNITGNFTTTGTYNFFSNPLRFTDDGVSGDLQPPLLVNAVDCCSYGDRMIWAHSPAFGLWGIYYDDSGFEGTLTLCTGNRPPGPT
jgi:hypothetical protein